VTADSFTVAAGRWAELDVLRNDASAAAGGGSIELASQPTAGQAVVSRSVIRYLARAGSLGVDSFNYTCVAKDGTRSSAVVTLNVTAGSCSSNMCGPSRTLGECDAATGLCICPAGSRLLPLFATNPTAAARIVAPLVRRAREASGIYANAMTAYSINVEHR
jgi:hypothetical protein